MFEATVLSGLEMTGPSIEIACITALPTIPCTEPFASVRRVTQRNGLLQQAGNTEQATTVSVPQASSL